ncbi:hypothetical protein GOP47_0024230 [Adiantum capillus-veneris]|uniref:Uncharacterized protein n=1 Tax=Adiantum capillus-veneris TaxID=13818 RepID=A0A9D4U604_ADICA|nr:hypothetical protein GOP47_0024230 [Adiantum capillus-veneris]
MHLDTILSMAADFYAALFIADIITPKILSAREVVWSHAKLRVTADMSLALMAPFSFEDLHDAVCGLHLNTCLNDNGLTSEFFLEHWDVLHVHFESYSNVQKEEMPH